MNWSRRLGLLTLLVFAMTRPTLAADPTPELTPARASSFAR